MNQENGNATFSAPSSSEVDIQDPNRRSKISYTREFLLCLAKADNHSAVKLPLDVQLSISCVFQDGLLSPPFCVPDSRSQYSMPQNVAPKVPDNVNLLHRSIEPYKPPRRHKALPPSTRDNNDLLNGDTYGSSSEYTNQEKAEQEERGKDISGSMKENTSSPEFKIQQELESNSSNIMLHEDSNFTSELCLPDEDSLITFDEPFLMPEVENSAVIDSFISNPESNLIEADLLSPSSPRYWVEKLVESILDDESSPDPYLNDPMVHHGAELDDFCLSMYARQFYTQFCPNQLNPGRVQQDHNSFLKSSNDPVIHSFFSHSYPANKPYPFPLSHGDELIRRFDHEVSQSVFTQMINPGKFQLYSLCISQSLVPPQLPELQIASCKQNLNPMQNCLGHQKPSCGGFIRGNPDFHGDGDINQAVVDSFVDTRLRATLGHTFVGGF